MIAGPPGLATQWTTAEALAAAAATWRTTGAVRLPAALAPGLAAELAVGLRQLPLTLRERAGEIVWTRDVEIPPVRDPQLFEPLFRVVHLLTVTLPALCRVITGRAVVAATPEAVEVVGYRKGSWTDAASLGPPHAIACTIAIIGGDWPPAWGGHDERLEPSGAVAWCGPATAGTIELADVSSVRRVAVVTRRVDRLELRGLLVPATEAA